MRIDFFAQQQQFRRCGRLCHRQRFADAQLEAGGGADLRQRHAWMQTVDLHTFALVVIAQDGQVGDDAIGSAVRRQSRRLARTGAGQVARRRQEIEFLDEATAIVMSDDEDAPAERSEIVSAAAAGQTHFRTEVIAADVRRIEIAIGIDLAPPRKV